eukprot:14398220-Ditylum_brightwellii.AAC.1
MIDAILHFYTYGQGRYTKNLTYLCKFKSLVAVVEQHSGNVAEHESLIEMETLDGAIPDQLQRAKQVSKEKYLARAFILKVCKMRYRKLIEDLQNKFMRGHSGYPDTLDRSYNMINSFSNRSGKPNDSTSSAISFVTVGKEDKDGDSDKV